MAVQPGLQTMMCASLRVCARREAAHARRCTAADLSKNGIGVAGVTALAQALSHNEALQTLVLDTNSAGDEGAEVLARHLTGAHACPCCCLFWHCMSST